MFSLDYFMYQVLHSCIKLAVKSSFDASCEAGKGEFQALR